MKVNKLVLASLGLFAVAGIVTNVSANRNTEVQDSSLTRNVMQKLRKLDTCLYKNTHVTAQQIDEWKRIVRVNNFGTIFGFGERKIDQLFRQEGNSFVPTISGKDWMSSEDYSTLKKVLGECGEAAAIEEIPEEHRYLSTEEIR